MFDAFERGEDARGIAAEVTFGISALVDGDETGPARARVVTPAAGQGFATADAAERWLADDRDVGHAARSLPLSPDAAEQWIGTSVSPSALPLSPDAAEHWVDSQLPRSVAPYSADAAERWLTAD